MSKNPVRLSLLAAAMALAFTGSALAAETGTVSQEVLDARREGQIWSTYAVNPHLRALDISVEVRGTKALLTGTVESAVEKDLAEQIALGVNGVKTVDNKLKIDANYTPKARVTAANERDFSTTVQDATITASVKSKLLWNSNTEGLKIDVDTRNGKVTLNGTADTTTAKDLAGRLARNTDNVVGVDNRLTIDPKSRTVAVTTTTADGKTPVAVAVQPIPDAWITAKVKSTLLYSTDVDGLDITVETTNGLVKLVGQVESKNERDQAIQLATSVRGVKKVDASALKSG